MKVCYFVPSHPARAHSQDVGLKRCPKATPGRRAGMFRDSIKQSCQSHVACVTSIRLAVQVLSHGISVWWHLFCSMGEWGQCLSEQREKQTQPACQKKLKSRLLCNCHPSLPIKVLESDNTAAFGADVTSLLGRLQCKAKSNTCAKHVVTHTIENLDSIQPFLC